ncbi:uncharacterized protein LOC132034992 [Lycium ferocissimum]|uniref:uncharacterized protein LOC132034992 n=1 Tax=Lycium ferocissimum TaxID=112874 RepID=UPI0028163B28|nr:uncharacterized protein LOC132034992 [Lycium ferocissimum]
MLAEVQPTVTPQDSALDIDVRGAIQLLTQIVVTYAQHQETTPSASASGALNCSRTKEFLHMRPPVFIGTVKGEDSQNFIDELQKMPSLTTSNRLSPDMRARVRRFVLGLIPDLYGDANIAAQNREMTIIKIVVFVQDNEDRMKEEEALQKEKDREL